MTSTDKPVAIIMGSQSDWPTMKHAAEILDELGVGHEALIVSAHRTPDRLYDFAKSARENGFKVIIAGAGGAAHLPGMTASLTSLPVFGVPMNTSALEGKDSLLSILQMPPGVPVGTLAIGKAGAINAALLACAVLALADPALAGRLDRLARAPDRLGCDRAERLIGRDAAAGLDHRDSGGRAARPHAGAGRRAPWIQVPRILSRAGIAGLRRRATGDRGRLRRYRRACPFC
jgi:5-(carboxyamino)imidazole ribonucleotide mutase